MTHPTTDPDPAPISDAGPGTPDDAARVRADGPSTAPPGFDRRLTPPLILGSLLNPINSSMIAVTLVPIGIAFGAPPSTTLWLVSALYLATAVGQPAVGRLVDRFGARPVYLVGTALVGLAGLLGMVAPTFGVLVAARVLLGFGTCAAYPAAMSLIRREAARTGVDAPAAVLTALSVAAQASSAIGPTLGGLLVGAGGWRTVFAVNVPLAIACLVLGRTRLPHIPPDAGTPVTAARRGSLDLPGMGLFAAAMTALLLYLMSPGLDDLWLLAVAALLGWLLGRRELRVPDPFLDLRTLAGNRALLSTYARHTLNYTVSYAVLYGFTQWLEDGRGLGETAAGLVLLPMSLTAIGTATLTGRRPEIRGKLLVGSGSMATACALLLLLGAHVPLWAPIGIGLLFGVPQGLNSLANQNALYHQAPPERIGTASGLLRTFQYLGAMLASALIAGIFSGSADTAGLHTLALVMLGCAVVLLLGSAIDPTLGPRARSRSGGGIRNP